MLRLLVILAALILIPVSAEANRVERSIVSQLEAQGFGNIEVSRTLLGRGRISAQSNTLDREIIFNPVTGAILRDYSRERAAGGLLDPAGGAPARGDPDDDGDDGDDGDGESDGDGDGDGEGDGDGDGEGGGDD